MASSEPIAPVLPGETLAGKYRVERILGKGGMGIVVAARHLELEERVAIKFLLRDNPDSVERFLREARTAAKVKSEHVCRVYDVGRLDSGEPYLVMEYLEGIDLADRLAKDGPLPVALVAGWMIEACAALAEAHALGIVHRDLKPANVFLASRANGTTSVKLLDFGVSKLASSDAMTSTSALVGSPSYMSPEQLVSPRSVDHRADIWSLGATMHELVTGAPPFVADSVIQLTVMIREGSPPPPSSLVSSIPSEFDALVSRCLEKSAGDRYADVNALALALAPFAEASSRHLAERIGRDRQRPNMDPALVETAHDPDSVRRITSPVAQSVAAMPGVGQVTLEPLTDGRTTTATVSRRWLPMAALAAVAIAVFAGTRPWKTAADGQTALPSAVPSVTAALASTATPIGTSMQAPTTTASVEVPPTRTAPPSAGKSAPRPPSAPPAQPSATPSETPPVANSAPASPTPSSPPASDANPRRKRTLDRSDPYAH